MAEQRQIVFTHQEIAELLIKKQGIHEGFWGIYFELGLAGGTIPSPPAGTAIIPAAMVLINKVGILRFNQPNSLTVDASKVNPATESSADT
jgi:hypothetical protein